MIRRIRYRLGVACTTAILASMAGVGLTTGVAHADLPAGKTFDLAGAGSDTTTPVIDAIAGIATPGVQGTDSNLLNSFDALGTATVNSTDFFTPPGVTCTAETRPNGSGQGLKAVAGTLAGTTAGCFQFARMSRGPSASDPTGFTWIPFAVDVVDFAVTNTSQVPRTLSLAELQAYYTCQSSVVGTQSPGNPGFNEFARNPVLPQSGSGTRLFWETLMGITDTAVGSGTFGGGTLGCIINGVNPSNPSQVWEEHTGTLLGDYELEPFSIPQYEIQAEGLILDQRGRSVLGDLQNVDGSIWQPQVLNVTGSQTGVAVPTAFEREVYNTVPTVDVTGTPVTNGSNTTTSVTLDIANTLYFNTGGSIVVAGATGTWASINGTWTISSVVANVSVTFTVTTAPTGSISGTVTATNALDQEIQAVFVGASSDVCSASSFSGKIRSTLLQYHLLPDSNCGSTTLTH